MHKHDSTSSAQKGVSQKPSRKKRMTGLFAAAAALMSPSAAFAKNSDDGRSFAEVAAAMSVDTPDAQTLEPPRQRTMMLYTTPLQQPRPALVLPSLRDLSRPHFSDMRVQLAAPAWGNDPRFAELVLDANTGEIVYERNGLAARNIASMTKVMTAYLVFDKIRKGEWTADTMLTASRYAASQAGMRFGLRTGQQVSVGQALNALVTISANDIAVLLAESIGGSESAFAEKMTETAHGFGAIRTTFGSASGRFGDDSTAYDMALMFRRISMDFPDLYAQYFTANCHWCDTPDVAAIHATGKKTGTRSVAGHAVTVEIEENGRRFILVGIGAGSNPQRFGRAIEMGRAVWSQLPSPGVAVEMAAQAPPAAAVAAPNPQG